MKKLLRDRGCHQGDLNSKNLNGGEGPTWVEGKRGGEAKDSKAQEK